MIPMDDAERTLRVLESLYCMRLHPAIDDFGAGYSSLSALQQFPISTLKIDKSFVRAVAVDRDDAMIAATIIAMAHSLKLDVIAEGVEGCLVSFKPLRYSCADEGPVDVEVTI